ncbi:MurR/RpiR family transcriptional regulator [Nocardiopsis changdeensis]|uniref:MurR/RpiR family transcriptional regulator n=1 Tax=Nocardiopsis changdeensis TaxID=2831969 RepID=A0ABX8BMQ0_9ACTN|nr:MULTISPECIES: MurR/RpiR family transcriptional regulator [Nocardiopsis]QUX21683.1 MurR/RpiR family transcriptional regulator [Nocardiopsis changdeensis]QYX37617.1 MurR/RpiR family transcriptional regulator [Nocardiopsis sp. MT53]
MADWIEAALGGGRLGRAAERVVRVLRDEQKFASYASTAEVAERAGVNVATVVRAAQTLGFSGWPALRLELRSRYLASLSAGEVLAEHAGSDADPVQAAFRADREGLRGLEATIEPDRVRALAAAIHGARRTGVVGSGTFAAPGLQLAHAAGIMGYDVVRFEVGGTALVSALARMGPEDLFLACDLWRLPTALRSAARVAAGRSVPVAVITDRRDSPLAQGAAHVLLVPSEGVGMFPSLTPAMSVIHAVLAELARIGGERVLRAVRDTERLWEETELF